MRQQLLIAAMVAGIAAPAAAHPGPRVWIGSDRGALATFTSDNDLAPTSFSPAKLILGGVDETTRIANGRMDEFPLAGSNVFATNFPGFQGRTDHPGDGAAGGLNFGTTVGFKTAGPLLVFDGVNHVYHTTQQAYGNPGPVPQLGISQSNGAGGTVVTASSPMNGFNFYSYNSATDHAHPVVTLLPQGTVPPAGQTPGDGPHAIYALPLRLTAAGYNDSLPFVILYGRGLGYPDDALFADARNVALTSYGLPGDADLDGDVDVADLGILASHWQQTGFWTDGDFDNDGQINVADLGMLATNWQLGTGSLQSAIDALRLPNVAIPEPTAAGWFLGLAIGMRRPVRLLKPRPQSVR
jgi:hypothetical protein